MKTLVLGGYGNFGARICKALAAEFGPHLLVGGRDAQRASGFAHSLGHGVHGVGVDHAAPDFAQRLRALGIELLIHTAGPFQGQAYAVAKAAASAQAHYIDLSDGRQFVVGFGQALSTAFMAAGRTAITGASTVPALSSAVVDYLCRAWQRIDSIDVCIAPAQTAPRGKATLAGVLSYCGEPITVWSDGRWQEQTGWAAPQSVAFARLRSRKGALCDIPDLALFPTHYDVRNRVMFRAALEVGITQQAFAVLASLRARRWIGPLVQLAGPLNWSARAFDGLGSALGGMVVRVQGLNAAGQPSQRAWHIAADHDHGPEIPCMAAILLSRRLARGQALAMGAFTSMGMLKLEEFEPEFVRWGMVTDVVEEALSNEKAAA